VGDTLRRGQSCRYAKTDGGRASPIARAGARASVHGVRRRGCCGSRLGHLARQWLPWPSCAATSALQARHCAATEGKRTPSSWAATWESAEGRAGPLHGAEHRRDAAQRISWCRMASWSRSLDSASMPARSGYRDHVCLGGARSIARSSLIRAAVDLPERVEATSTRGYVFRISIVTSCTTRGTRAGSPRLWRALPHPGLRGPSEPNRDRQ